MENEASRDEMRARAANLLRGGASIRAIAEELGIGRTAAATLAREIEAETAALPMIDAREAAEQTMADALIEARAAAAALDRLREAAEKDGDHRTALAVLREQRLQRAERVRTAAALAAAAPAEPRAIEAHAAETP